MPLDYLLHFLRGYIFAPPPDNILFAVNRSTGSQRRPASPDPRYAANQRAGPGRSVRIAPVAGHYRRIFDSDFPTASVPSGCPASSTIRISLTNAGVRMPSRPARGIGPPRFANPLNRPVAGFVIPNPTMMAGPKRFLKGLQKLRGKGRRAVKQAHLVIRVGRRGGCFANTGSSFR